MNRVGILGGTFDPPHIGHLIIAEEARIALQLDEVWFIPTNEPPHKDDAATTAADRVEMVQLAIKENEAFKVNTIEIERAGKSYTFDTISLLQEQYPKVDFHFIIGADMVEYLPHWYRIDELMQGLTFVGVKRPGYELNTSYPIVEVDIPMIDLSSTIIKQRFSEGRTAHYLLPESVYTYICQERLYGHN